jgi:hypothetical protein
MECFHFAKRRMARNNDEAKKPSSEYVKRFRVSRPEAWQAAVRDGAQNGASPRENRWRYGTSLPLCLS